MSITIRDVARRAGVSPATVSRVLNDTCPVAEDKRTLVLQAADALGYSPNPAARSLLNKETGAIGVLLPFVSAEFFSEFLTGLDGAAQGLGFLLTLSTSHRRPDEFEAAMRAMEKRVDGLIVMAPEFEASEVDALPGIGGPVVFVNTYGGPEGHPTINFDNYGGAHALTRHLLDLGHRRIAHVHGPPGARDARERSRGYRAALAESGLDVAPVEVAGDYTQDAGYDAARVLLGRTPRPTAVVAANDYCAVGVLRALHEAGMDVPGEMAVTGFDGVTSARYTLPPLTTAQVPMREIGRRAVTRLVARLRGDARDAPREVLPVEIVVRGSTRPARD